MVFSNLDFEIRSGECLVLIGPSGIGKSTLLRLLLRTLQPESGTILFDGEDVVHLTRDQLNRLRTRIGMVFQSSALISSLSVFENLAISLRGANQQERARNYGDCGREAAVCGFGRRKRPHAV